MNVLMISGDPLALDSRSAVHARLLLQAGQTDFLEVFAPAREEGTVPLGERGRVRGFAGSKLAAARRMRHAARGLSFSLVTAQDPFFLGLLAWRVARRARAKLQLQIHTDVCSVAYLKKNPLRYALAQFLLRRADCVRVVSARLKEHLEESGIRAPISVLPIFIDGEAIVQAPKTDLKNTYPQFSHILLIAARLEQEKNIGRILAAMPEILKQLPQAGLLIAGEGRERTALEVQVKKLGLAGNVVFLGRRSDVYSLYKGADLVIAATADYEGYGAATIEALAAGVPVISADVGVAREAGAIVAAPKELAAAAVRLLSLGQRGALAITLPSASEWVVKWRESLGHCGTL